MRIMCLELSQNYLIYIVKHASETMDEVLEHPTDTLIVVIINKNIGDNKVIL